MSTVEMIRLAGGMEYIYWLALIGKSRTTGWRWRKKGWVSCFKIDGTWYISAVEINRFWERAQAGEFAGRARGAARDGKAAA